MAAKDNYVNNNINSTSARFQQFCTTNPAASLHIPISEHDLRRHDHDTSDNQIPLASVADENVTAYTSNMKCCCGRADCAYLKHNDTALGGLERDLDTAARLGKVRAPVIDGDIVLRSLS